MRTVSSVIFKALMIPITVEVKNETPVIFLVTKVRGIMSLRTYGMKGFVGEMRGSNMYDNCTNSNSDGIKCVPFY